MGRLSSQESATKRTAASSSPPHRERPHRERQNGLQRHGTTNPATIATTRKELSKEGALSRKRERERKGRKRRGNRNLSNLTRAFRWERAPKTVAATESAVSLATAWKASAT